MNIAIVGAKERDTPADRALVEQLLAKLYHEFPHCMFVVALSHTGVGFFVKEICLHKADGTHYRYAFLDCEVRIYAHDLSKADLTQIFLSRNATPFELSDMLIYLTGRERRGTMEDLLVRFQKAGRPVFIIEPGEAIPPNFALRPVTVKG